MGLSSSRRTKIQKKRFLIVDGLLTINFNIFKKK